MSIKQMKPKVAIMGVPIHAMIVPFPIGCFVGALMTDIIYAETSQIQYANFSAWFLAFGMFMGCVAAFFGLIDLFFSAVKPRPAIVWWHMGGNLLILVIVLANNFIHARDGWTSVVPTGLTLSAITVALLVVTGFMGHLLAYRHVRGDRS